MTPVDFAQISNESLMSSYASLKVGNSPRHSIGNVVAIDDDKITLRALQGHAKRHGYRLHSAENVASGLELINEATTAVLIDLRMPDIDGFECLKFIRESHPHVKIIVLTGSSETSDAVEAMRAGAFEFVTKPFAPVQLLDCLKKAGVTSPNSVENSELREPKRQLSQSQTPVVSGYLSSHLMSQITRLAAVDSTVFIGGESGTGKSTVARMIHQLSNRASRPFVSINCASLPRDLLTSELFGHTKGSFTGAFKDRAGHAEVADGGTLFLDEIGDLPLELQPKLLTFLQDRTIQRLGSSEVRKVDVRLIVATHRDLAEMCREQIFRPDLYFRLMVLSIDLSPLRDRRAEFPLMAAAILDRICERMNVERKNLTEGAMSVLLEHTWPGNIRELENVLERAVAFSAESQIHVRDLVVTNIALDRRGRNSQLTTDVGIEQDSTFTRDAPILTTPVPFVLTTETIEPNQSQPCEGQIQVTPNQLATGQSSRVAAPDGSSTGYVLFGKTLAEIERDAIEQTLQACHGNKAKTARILGISEKSIYNKIRRLCVAPIPSDEPK